MVGGIFLFGRPLPDIGIVRYRLLGWLFLGLRLSLVALGILFGSSQRPFLSVAMDLLDLVSVDGNRNFVSVQKQVYPVLLDTLNDGSVLKDIVYEANPIAFVWARVEVDDRVEE